jgi:hypothetical protein
LTLGLAGSKSGTKIETAGRELDFRMIDNTKQKETERVI